MNTGYTIYQVERTKSAAEQREVDRSNAELAAGPAGPDGRGQCAPVGAGHHRLSGPESPGKTSGICPPLTSG
jgi:hypothetical protein